LQIDKQLLESIAFYPNSSVLCYGNFSDEYLELISNLVKKQDGSLLLYSDSKNREFANIKTKKIEDGFRATSREFELIIFNNLKQNIVNHQMLFNKFYNYLENSGQIIVYADISYKNDFYNYLESVEFRAVNIIEQDNNLIFTGKKMHMWKDDLT
jgi:hypothetical protein